MIVWLKKFISGFAIWKGPQLGKFLFFSIIIIGWLFVFYKIAIKPTTTQTQKQETNTTIRNSKIDRVLITSGQEQNAGWIPDVEVERSTQGKETVFRLKWSF